MDFVFALSARLETLQALSDAIFKTLIVAGFEMQAIEIGPTPPMAAIQRGVVAKADGPGDFPVPVLSQHQDQAPSQSRGDL